MSNVFVIEPNKCTGCRMCEARCSWWHEKEISPVKSRIKAFKLAEQGIDLPIVCMHCEDAPCQTVCPVDAIAREDQTNGVQISEAKCIGCRACMIVCPYGAISMDTDKRKVIKCDLCEGDPQCVKYCVTKAIQWQPAKRADMVRRTAMMKELTAGLTKAAAVSR